MAGWSEAGMLFDHELQQDLRPEWQCECFCNTAVLSHRLVFMQYSSASKCNKSWCFSFCRGIQNSKWVEDELECSGFQNVALLLHKNTRTMLSLHSTAEVDLFHSTTEHPHSDGVLPCSQLVRKNKTCLGTNFVFSNVRQISVWIRETRWTSSIGS